MSDDFGLLFARPSAIEGIARILDFGNTLTEYNRSITPEQADDLALRSDWAAVGRDIRVAINGAPELIGVKPDR